MNERIKVLAEQAKFMAEETINKKISKNAELDAFAEKFAELIVRECAGMFEGVYTDQTWPERIDKRIKQHFGVE